MIDQSLKKCAGLFGAGISLVLLVTVLPTESTAQEPEYRTETVRGPGNWPIRFTYYPALASGKFDSREVKNAPVLILLHGRGGRRDFWDKTSAFPGTNKAFAPILQAQGYAVLALDVRKHGDSAPEGNNKILAQDYEAMVGDLIAIKEFLFAEHQKQALNMRKLGIIAMDDLCPVAATYAEYDWLQPPYDDHAIPAKRTPRGQDVKALVFISPSVNAGRVQLTKPLRYLSNPSLRIAFQVVSGKKDRNHSKARSIYKFFSGKKANERRIEFVELNTNEKSKNLFGNPRIQVEVRIVKFLNDHLRNLDIPWQDRRSRRDRED